MSAPATVDAAMRRDILLDPAADDLRLIYADWLMDHGQEQYGEFIAHQVQHRQQTDRPKKLTADAIGGLLGSWVGAPVQRVKAKAGNLLVANFGYGTVVAVKRGFVRSVTTSVARWLTQGTAAVADQPIGAVHLTGASPRHTPPFDGRRRVSRFWFWTAAATPVAEWNRAKFDEGFGEVPEEFFELLHEAPSLNAENNDTAHGAAEFATRPAAVKALNWAALTWARRRAGLPDATKPKGMTP